MLFFWFIQLPYDRRVTSELKHLYNLTEDLNLKNSIEVIKNALRGNFGTKHGTKMLGCQWSTVVSTGIKNPLSLDFTGIAGLLWFLKKPSFGGVINMKSRSGVAQSVPRSEDF